MDHSTEKFGAVSQLGKFRGRASLNGLGEKRGYAKLSQFVVC